MRYEKSETGNILAIFNPSDSATIDVYNLATNAQVVTNAAMSEVASTGTFKYLLNQVVTAKTEFLWIATNGTNVRQGKVVVGGYMDGLALEATSQAIKTETDKIASIPTNPLLVNDPRIDAIKSQTDQLAFTGGNINAIAQVVADKTSYELSTADKDALAVVVEAALLNEGDSQQLIDAIVQNISTNLDLSGTDLASIASAVRTELAAELAHLDADISSIQGMTESGLHAGLNSYANKADWKAQSVTIGTADKDDIAEKVLSRQVN